MSLMQKFLSRWRASHAGNAELGLQTMHPSLLWDLPSNPTPLDWDHRELAVLLQAEQQKRQCSVAVSGHSPERQTVVLGFDIRDGKLLLDEFFPAPPAGAFADCIHWDLMLNSDHGCLDLKIELMAPLNGGVTQIVEAAIVEKRFYPDRRRSPRAEFDYRESAPEVQLLLPMSSSIKGQVRDVSVDGFAMVYYTAQKPELVTREGDCTITFCEQFALRCRVEVIAINFQRSPCCHCVVRLKFKDLGQMQRERLCSLINCLNAETREGQAA